MLPKQILMVYHQEMPFKISEQLSQSSIDKKHPNREYFTIDSHFSKYLVPPHLICVEVSEFFDAKDLYSDIELFIILIQESLVNEEMAIPEILSRLQYKNILVVCEKKKLRKFWDLENPDFNVKVSGFQSFFKDLTNLLREIDNNYRYKVDQSSFLDSFPNFYEKNIQNKQEVLAYLDKIDLDIKNESEKVEKRLNIMKETLFKIYQNFSLYIEKIKSDLKSIRIDLIKNDKINKYSLENFYSNQQFFIPFAFKLNEIQKTVDEIEKLHFLDSSNSPDTYFISLKHESVSKFDIFSESISKKVISVNDSNVLKSGNIVKNKNFLFFYGQSPRSIKKNEYFWLYDLNTNCFNDLFTSKYQINDLKFTDIEFKMHSILRHINRKCAGLLIFNGFIYIFGGINHENPLENVKINIETIECCNLPTFPEKLHLKTCFACTINSKIYVAGNNKQKNIAKVYIFNDELQCFEVQNYKIPENGHNIMIRAIGEFNGRLFVVNKWAMIYENKSEIIRFDQKVKGKLVGNVCTSKTSIFFVTENMSWRRIYKISVFLEKIECIHKVQI